MSATALRVRAGLFRHKVTVQERARTFDGAGQPSDTWTTIVTPWASVEPLRGRELMQAREAGIEATHKVRMRWHDAFRADGHGRWRIGRILHRGRVLTPEGPPLDISERRQTVELWATERADDLETEVPDE